MVESVMFAIMSAAFLLCSHDRAKRVLLMVCSDKLALTLTRCVFFTTFALLVTPLIIACKLWSNHPLFERLTVYASFFSFLVASVIDLIFLFAFVKLLIEMDNESPPEAKSEASRFKIVATYGAVATSIYCCALGLSAYREIVATLIGMKIHSHSLKRHGRLQKEVNLQRVLKNELEVIRARSPIVTIERDRVHIEREGISRDTSVKTVASSTSMALDMLAKLEEGVATKQ
ncbi:hypothetical protein BC830DRAFT_556903 [Chytriomyces sp. MP71]|nr:hypothetical protein BC830DRAFT_556903 [Chytriomyces sp. MP71]